MNKLHPLTHVLICIYLSSMVFLVGSLGLLAVITMLAAVYASLRVKGGMQGVARSIVRSLTLILSLGIIQMLLNRSGDRLVGWGWVQIYSGGVYWSVVIGFRLLVIVMCAKALAVLSFAQFQAALAPLHLPEEIGFMLAYGTHLVPAFGAKIKGFLTTLRLRGLEPGKMPWRQRFVLYQKLSLTVLTEVLDQSTDAAVALELRGFRSSGKRSQLHACRLGKLDALSLLLIMLLSLILVRVFL